MFLLENKANFEIILSHRCSKDLMNHWLISVCKKCTTVTALAQSNLRVLRMKVPLITCTAPRHPNVIFAGRNPLKGSSLLRSIVLRWSDLCFISVAYRVSTDYSKLKLHRHVVMTCFSTAGKQ